MALTPTEKQIKACLTGIRSQILRGDNSEIMCWPLPGVLACSQRPLRDHPVYAPSQKTPPPLPPEARPIVAAWLGKVLENGMCSVICLLQQKQLDKYYVRGGLNLPGGGLLEYYRLQGLQVCHRSMTDYQRPSEIEMNRVLQDFNNLPKPVLIHCSAGIDRTTPVAAFIIERCRSGRGSV